MTASKATLHSLALNEERFIESNLGMGHDAPGTHVRHLRDPSGDGIPPDGRRAPLQGNSRQGPR